MSEPNAGMSKCPVCGKEWLVTPGNDCLLPACGCFGSDTSAANPNRICEPCGMHHFANCKKVAAAGRGKDEQ